MLAIIITAAIVAYNVYAVGCVYESWARAGYPTLEDIP